MFLQKIDWLIIVCFFAIVLIIGWLSSKKAGKSTLEYYLGGRGLPWWLLGVSMVACTFSADTPNLVTGMVREDGIAKNWAWWAFLITGMVTVFIYAKLWRRSGILTDLEFYEIRYSGKAASFLRGFRSLYLGVFFNCLIMGSVTLAAIKIGSVMLGLQPWVIVVGGSLVVVIYSVLGGIRGIIWTDFFQYTIAMAGAVIAAIVAVKQPEIGSLQNLVTHPAIQSKISFIPDLSHPSYYVPLLIIPIAVQWWSVWYPGAEPGGGGYIAQKMLAAKNEKNAMGASLFFNFAHYALRPWPWIIVALASMILYPDLASIQKDFPHIHANYLQDDVAYPVMLSKIQTGWLGLVVASIIGAYMSTIGTHLNWGSSYFVNDFYKRFVKPDSSEKHLVSVGRIITVVLMIFAGILALTILDNATQAFNILLLSGAGSGAIYLLRWFWWRINAWTEIVAMIVATVMAVILVFFISPEFLANTFHSFYPLPENYEMMSTAALERTVFPIKLLIAVFTTSIAWLMTAFLTKAEKQETLEEFYELTTPGGPGWKKVIKQAKRNGKNINQRNEGKAWEMPIQILLVFVGCVTIYSALFAIGSFIFSNFAAGLLLTAISLIGMVVLYRLFTKIKGSFLK